MKQKSQKKQKKQSSKKLYRVEIISNQSLQEDIIEEIENKIESVEYTVIPLVQGKGKKTKKLGSASWPEQNFSLFLYTNKENVAIIKEIISSIVKKSPNEGVALFATKAENISGD